jgi:periplasmic copper chaperone A
MVRLATLYRPFLALIAVGALATASQAHDYKSGDLMIEQPWIKATPAGAKTAAGYATLMNHGSSPDKLIGGSAEGVDKFEVHQMTMENNVMKMGEVKGGLEVKPGETVELKPGSYHIMMIGLKQPFKVGNMVRGTLVFEKAGTVNVEFKVEPMSGKAKDEAMDEHMHMHGAEHKDH